MRLERQLVLIEIPNHCTNALHHLFIYAICGVDMQREKVVSPCNKTRWTWRAYSGPCAFKFWGKRQGCPLNRCCSWALGKLHEHTEFTGKTVGVPRRLIGASPSDSRACSQACPLASYDRTKKEKPGLQFALRHMDFWVFLLCSNKILFTKQAVDFCILLSFVYICIHLFNKYWNSIV